MLAMDGGDATAFGQSIAFLLSQVGARSAQLFAERLTPYGIGPREFAVLSTLAARGRQTQQQLAEALGIHRNNMVTLIDAMETAGWIVRTRGVTDRRVFQISTTESGNHVVDQVNTLAMTLDHELSAPLTASQRATLVDVLHQIANHLDLTPAVHPHVASRPH